MSSDKKPNDREGKQEPQTKSTHSTQTHPTSTPLHFTPVDSHDQLHPNPHPYPHQPHPPPTAIHPTSPRKRYHRHRHHVQQKRQHCQHHPPTVTTATIPYTTTGASLDAALLLGAAPTIAGGTQGSREAARGAISSLSIHSITPTQAQHSTPAGRTTPPLKHPLIGFLRETKNSI